ncbi:MAG: hypothetical protein IJB11_06660 [Oscillospiraceae bacterium]|nr:hypothetical protein [Oscillospiraceae bacterium]
MANEKRDLIDRGRLLRDPYFQEDRYPESHLLRMAIKEQPTVDAVEVVRCKDCKHFVSPQGVPCCDNFYGLGFPAHSGDDFCSYGERRIDNA